MLWRLLLGFAAALLILVVGHHLFPPAVAPVVDVFRRGDQYDRQSGPTEVSFTVLRDWGTGMEARISLRNTGWKTLHDWTLFLEFPRTISKINGARVTAWAGSKYRIDAPTRGLNASIPPGATIQFTLLARPGGYGQVPATVLFNAWVYPQVRGRFNYAEALQKSLYFYEAQRSGKLPPSNRVHWRGDSALADGSDAGVDLSGGYYDAGDHMKFGLPLAGALTMLSWGGIQYRAGFEQCGEWERLLDTVRWGTDWLLKAHTKPNELYGQVGRGESDHDYWGPPEQMTMPRPAFKIDAEHPGSDLAGETSAALASASLLFARDDPAYSRRLLDHAIQLFEFADKYRGKYSDAIPDAQTFYESDSGYDDELIWAAAWLYRASGQRQYLEYAEKAYAALSQGSRTPGTHTWDDKHAGASVLLAQLTGKEIYRKDAERFLDFWTRGLKDERVTYTAGGLAWLQAWGALRYTANTAFLAFVYSDTVADEDNVYHRFARQQIHYILGDNPARRSYMVGFGANPPRNPHHRGAHGSTEGTIDAPTMNLNVLYGALVGGPFLPDDFAFSDNRRDERSSEVALDYNAAFTGALARMVMMYGGRPLKQLPP